MLTVLLAWLAAAAVCVAAVVFGQVARTAPRRRRRRRAARVGLFLSLSGPWLAFAGAVAAGAATGAWLQAAAGGALAVTVVAAVGLGLAPR